MGQRQKVRMIVTFDVDVSFHQELANRLKRIDGVGQYSSYDIESMLQDAMVVILHKQFGTTVYWEDVEVDLKREVVD